MRNSELLGTLTRGMLAGVVGTAVMTISERLEMTATGRIR